MLAFRRGEGGERLSPGGKKPVCGTSFLHELRRRHIEAGRASAATGLKRTILTLLCQINIKSIFLSACQQEDGGGEVCGGFLGAAGTQFHLPGSRSKAMHA